MEEHGAQLTVFNVNGVPVIQQEIQQNEGVINLAGLAKGMYVVQVFDGLYLTRKKIIKK